MVHHLYVFTFKYFIPEEKNDMDTPTKILAQDADTVAKRKAEFQPCKTCEGGGASIMKGTYIGDVEGQHGVCADCAGTGWANGKAWKEKMDMRSAQLDHNDGVLTNMKRAHERDVAAFAADKKRAEQALAMLAGLATRETALARRVEAVERRERDLADKQAQREKDNARALAALDEEREDIKRFRDEASFVREEIERYREEFRKPIKKLAKEVEALRETVEKLASK